MKRLVAISLVGLLAVGCSASRRAEPDAPDKPRDQVGPATLRPGGRVAARVGEETITLPELTGAVRRRLRLLPPGDKPDCGFVIGVARSTLESMIERSVILQEARRRHPDPARLEAALAELDRRWPSEGLPQLLRREGVAAEPELRRKLAARAESLDDLREGAKLRAMAGAWMAGEGAAGDLDAYLGALRRRTRIASINGPVEPPPAPDEPSAVDGVAKGPGG